MKKYFPEIMTALFFALVILKALGFSISWLCVFAPIYAPIVFVFVYAIEITVYNVFKHNNQEESNDPCKDQTN